MRVVIPALYYYPERPSGSSRLAFGEAEYLARQGHEVWLIAQDSRNDQPEYARREGIHVLHYRPPVLRAFDPRRAGMHQRMVRALLRKYISGPVDLLHGHTLLAYEGALDYFGGSVRSAYSIHSPVYLEMQAASRLASPLQRIKNRLTATLSNRIEARILHATDAITAESEFTQREIARLHGQQLGERVQVVPGWVDLNHFTIAEDRAALKQALALPLDVPLLFALRRLVPRNGLDQLLLALRQVQAAGHSFHMVIGGAGPLMESLQAQASALELPVQFLGRVPDADLPRYYAAADVCLMPTAALECFGLPTLEAFASGRPVLATAVGAIPELINPVEPAWLAESPTAAGLADLILRYLRGDLPGHDPAELRAFAARYENDRVIAELVRVALGQS